MMANQPKNIKAVARPAEKAEVAAAREELSVLDRLSLKLLSKISELASRRPSFDRRTTVADISVHESQRALLKGYEELAHHCYGRTVTGKEIDEREVERGRFTYRITQVNVGYPDDGCGIIARNSPLASKLVTAQPGEESEVPVRERVRYLITDEVRTFDGPSSLLSPSQKPNFQTMALRRERLRRPVVVENLRAFIQRLGGLAPDEIPAPKLGPAATPDTSTPPVGLPAGDAGFHRDSTWLEDWAGIHFGDSENFFLSHQFFTRTSLDQENALTNPRGITFVEGVGGSGKTSVALGRLKFFANFSTGEYLENYGLQGAPVNDFSPVGMVGFVLNHSLKRYLKETAIALGLERLPIRDFEEFRTDLSNQLGLAQRFKRRKTEAPPVRTTVAWLRALDAAMARAAASMLRDTLVEFQGVHPSVQQAVLKFVDNLSQADPVSDRAAFHLSGLADRLVAGISDAEQKVEEAVIHERHHRVRADLEASLRRLHDDARRGILSTFVRRLLARLTAHDLIAPAVQLDEFVSLVQRAFGSAIDSSLKQKLGDAVRTLREHLSDQDSDGRRSLTNSDLVALSALAGMIADGFERSDLYVAELGHLYQMRRNNAVFIDEVQDFTEIQIFLMGMTARSTYHQITLSGDRFQRLQSEGAETYQRLFPAVPRNRHNRSVFLDHNFRQADTLAALSAGFRSIVQGDARVEVDFDDSALPAMVHTFKSRERMAQLMLRRILSIASGATIAVITPTRADAELWYGLLEDDLAAYHRPALLSYRDDLTRRFHIHFTEARETKGLEFNAVIVPDLGAFSLHTPIGRNEAYVAISRPRHALLIGCNENSIDRPEIKKLIQHKLIRAAEVPGALAH
jgi:hypothetical protein